MIRYDTTRAHLEKQIGKAWLDSARKKTAAFRKARRYNEKQGSWSAIKQVYIDLQHGKCAYCERRFGTDEKSRIEHDVEHFRPKSAVKAWPPAKHRAAYNFSTGPASQTGYYLLAYDILNYAVACKKCNSPYKSNYFPIEAPRRALHTGKPDILAKELPFLIYPICSVDDDPENLITFEGFLPTPRATRGRAHRRARVTIDFFDLDLREELLRERAIIIKAIYVAGEDLRHADSLRRADAEQTIRHIQHPGFPHRNCARAFYRLFEADRSTAREYYKASIDYLDSVSGG